ncbi:MAG: DUF4912 domain-containing protein [Polyangiales bacterium]
MEKRDTREALSALGKDELVARAEALGIDGARKFTKIELVGEIIRAAGSTDRGLLGKARDLLRDVVERGLSRAVAPKDVAPASQERPSVELPEPPVPTLTLAEIYLGQGHAARAKAIAQEILRNDPTDEAARAFLDKAEAPVVKAASPAKPATEGLFPDDPYAAIGIEREAFEEPLPPKAEDTPAMLDDAPFPARYDVDECVAMAVDPTTIYVYWETRKSSIERAQRVIKGDPKSTLRVLVVEPSDKGPHVHTRDFDVIDLEYGEWFVRDLPAGSIVRAAIGVRAGERFLPIAHTLDVEAPWATPSKTVARDKVIWSEEGTRPKTGADARPAPIPLERDAGMLGLPPLPEAPEPPDLGIDEDSTGRGLSSADLARRKRIASARSALAAGPTSASFLDKN